MKKNSAKKTRQHYTGYQVAVLNKTHGYPEFYLRDENWSQFWKRPEQLDENGVKKLPRYNKADCIAHAREYKIANPESRVAIYKTVSTIIENF